MIQASAPFSMSDLLAEGTNCPVFVINGARTPAYRSPTRNCFEGRRTQTTALATYRHRASECRENHDAIED